MVTGGLTPRAAVTLVQQRLAAAGCPDADFDARELFRLATGRDPRLSERVLTEEQAARLETLCQRRESREPLQYLCGRWPFLDFELAVGPGVLCPRADTEVVAEAAAQTLAGCAAPKVLDLCAGTGCLGLGIKRLCPTASVTCVEKSPEALHYLVCNVRTALRSLPQGSTEDVLEEDEPTLGSGLLGIAALPPAAQAVEGDLFDYWRGLPEGGLDLIVSNPPYLTASEMEDLQPEVAKEPAMALAAGEDGLDFYRALARHYQNPLRPGGTLALEIGWQQREAVCALLQAEGWTQIRCIQDLGGNDRCILAQRPE
ncbi:MAG: peptide chain release factor N(5)-glutamine methyltransferase [Faecalibacterium prausnitzii]|nr:peptide chain release factor N(5)-glutamine methyltransferase [Faecalibacterium prausnitzii]